MNHRLMFFLTLAIAFGLLAGCGSKSSESSATKDTEEPIAGTDASDSPTNPGGGSLYEAPPCPDVQGPEICDGLDNDCNGIIDDDYLLQCELCEGEAGCVHATIAGGAWAVGTRRNLASGNDRGIALPPAPIASEYLYIANSLDDTVSKLRISDGDEVGRFVVGDNPSRTAVDGNGDAWVVMRGVTNDNNPGETENVVKIDGSCIPDIAPPAVTHECILLDIADVSQLLRGIAIDAEGDVWVASHANMEIVHLDGEVGIELGRYPIEPEARPYGLAIDENGFLWVAAIVGEAKILRFDPFNKTFDIALTEDDLDGHSPYGLAPDGAGGMWFGVNNDAVLRVATDTGEVGPIHEVGSVTRGVTVDDEGFVWAADSAEDAIHRIDPVTGEYQTIMAGNQPVGVAVDHEGDIWTSNLSSDDATQISSTGEVLGTYPVGNSPYTYSDMTGNAFRVFKRLRGIYRATYDSGAAGASWTAVQWDANLPEDAVFELSVRASDSDEMTGAWTDVDTATAPSELSITGRYLEVEIVLESDDRQDPPFVVSVTATFEN